MIKNTPWLHARLGISLLLLILTGGGFVFAQESPQTVKVGVYPNEPKIFIDEDGNAEGFFPDLITHLSNKLDFRVEYVEVSWSEGLRLLREGAIDIMPDVVPTPARDANYTFNRVTILENWASLYIHEDAEPEYYTLQNIGGKSVAVMEEDANYEAFKTELGADSSRVQFMELDSYGEAFQAVSEGKADMALVNYYFGRYRTDDYDVQQLELVINPSTVNLMARAETSALLHRIDQEIIRLKENEDSEYYSLIEKWLDPDDYFRFPRWLSWTLTALVVFLLFLLMTITALQIRLKKGRKELYKINHKLKNQVKKKSRMEEKLLVKNHELERTNEAMDQLIYQVSHNLRAPIASALGLINILRIELQPSEASAEPIAKMEESMRQLDTIISDILDYYRNSRTEVACEKVELETMIQGIFSSMEHIYTEKPIEMSSDVTGNYTLYSDSRRLKSILNNLISNALKYCDPSKDSAFVKFSAEINEHMAVLKVEDNGQGIPEQYQDKVYSMFFRGTSRGNGAGLGLYIIKETLEKMEGRIEMSSEVGRGTTFTITLPNLQKPVPVPTI